MGYNVAALDHTISGKIPAEIVCLLTLFIILWPVTDFVETCVIPERLPFLVPSSLRILRRCTIILADPSQNHRLSAVASHYDILGLRPTNERALLQACQSLECDLISMDLSTRMPFYFKMKTLSLALQRGVKFEICYAPGVLAADGGASRRNLISGATQLIRATRGKGIIISSEARKALACRGPWDVINLATIWGLGHERGVEAVGKESRSVVVHAEMKRRSFKGVIDVVYGGEKPERHQEEPRVSEKGKGTKKRKAEVLEDENEPDKGASQPLSKRQQKRLAKAARLANAKEGSPVPVIDSNLASVPSGQTQSNAALDNAKI